MKIALDSGHGESTEGKRSFDGILREYEFNHDVTRRLSRHLERHGFEVFLTSPDSNFDPSLAERCRRANNAGADLFLSIHANAAGTDWNSGRGWEAYISTKSGSAYELAKCIYHESIPFLGLRDRGLKTSNFTVLTGTKMPAVLIEHGFYTNRTECALLLTDAFREKCALADAKGVLRFLNVAWKEIDQSTAAPVIAEVQDPQEIVWVLGEFGVITDKTGFLAALAEQPNGPLYWLCRKTVNYIRFKNLPVKASAQQKLTSINDIVWFLGDIGIVTDKALFLREMEKEPNGRLYWTARKITALLQSGM